MPKSKRSARSRAATSRPTHPPASSAEPSPTPTPSRRKRRIRENRWVALPLIVVGAVLFLMGNIGARTGIHFIPFDPHHVIEQLGGVGLLLVGLMLL
jgi:hypothetical protein